MAMFLALRRITADARRNGPVTPVMILAEREDALRLQLQATTAAAVEVAGALVSTSDAQVLSDAVAASTTITSLRFRGAWLETRNEGVGCTHVTQT